jgi:riboflavin synthase
VFTGLVQATGQITGVQRLADGVQIRVAAEGLAPRPIALGDSIAVNGVCLTVTSHTDGHFTADVSRASLDRTCGLDHAGTPVNLEAALALGERLGGHLVSGHVDGVGRIERLEARGESTGLIIGVPAALARYMVAKGSVAVHGVSLTVNAVEDLPSGDCRIDINLIAHTVQATVFRSARAGDPVNLEIDTLARYLERLQGWNARFGGTA